MPKCSYCKRQYENPRGTTVVMNDGNPRFYCSLKCRKNATMKRRKVRWVSKKTKSEKAEEKK